MVAYSIPVYPSSAGFERTPVDAFATYALAMERPGWCQAGGGHTVFVGKCDHEALALSMEEAAASRPIFSSNLAAIGPAWSQELVWRHQERPWKPELVDLTGKPRPDENLAQWLDDYSGLAAYEPDLTVDFPFRTIIYKLADDLHALGSSTHHAAADLGTLTPYNLEVRERYEKRVLGDRATSGPQLTGEFAGRSRPAPTMLSFREFTRLMRSEAKEYPRKLTAHPIGTPGRAKRISAEAVVPMDLVEILRSRARSDGGSLTDIVVATTKLAVVEWNGARGKPPEIQRHNVAVAQRGRVAGRADSGAANQLSMVTVCTKASDWDDPQQLLGKVIGVRLGRMDQGVDVMFNRVSERSLAILSVLPVEMRMKALRRGTKADQTLMVSNWGAPVREKAPDGTARKMTERRPFGEMVYQEHTNYGMAMPQNPYSLSMAARVDGMHLKMSSNEEVMTLGELEQLHETVVGLLNVYAT